MPRTPSYFQPRISLISWGSAVAGSGPPATVANFPRPSRSGGTDIGADRRSSAGFVLSRKRRRAPNETLLKSCRGRGSVGAADAQLLFRPLIARTTIGAICIGPAKRLARVRDTSLLGQICAGQPISAIVLAKSAGLADAAIDVRCRIGETPCPAALRQIRIESTDQIRISTGIVDVLARLPQLLGDDLILKTISELVTGITGECEPQGEGERGEKKTSGRHERERNERGEQRSPPTSVNSHASASWSSELGRYGPLRSIFGSEIASNHTSRLARPCLRI